MPPPTRHVVAHSAVLGAMRNAARCGSLSGSASATRRARSQFIRAARISRAADQLPARICQVVSGTQISGGLQVLGDQGGVLVCRSDALSISAAKSPVQFRPIRFELRLVRHRPDERIAEDELGFAGESDLIDELGGHQVGRQLVRPRAVQQVEAEPRADHRRGAQRLFRLRVESVDAGGDRCLQRRGHAHLGDVGGDSICAGLPSSTPRSASSRTISSAKNGLPAALSAIDSPSSPTDGSEPEQFGDERGVSESRSGARAMVCAPATRSTHPGTRAGT